MPTTAIAGQVEIKKGAAHPFDGHPDKQIVDFYVDAPYVIDFKDPTVFGIASTTLKTGHNPMRVKVKSGRTEYRVHQKNSSVAITEEVAVSSVGCGGATMVTESVMAYSTASAFGPTGNILVP